MKCFVWPILLTALLIDMSLPSNVASAQTSTTRDTATTNSEDAARSSAQGDKGRWDNVGWFGLLGLAGLAGLFGKKNAN